MISESSSTNNMTSESRVGSIRMKENGDEDTGSDGIMVRFSTAVNGFLARVFNKVGKAAGGYPWVTIFVSLLVTVAMGAAFMDFKQESQPEKLFVPQGTRSLSDKADVEKFYGSNTRFVSLLVTTKGDSLGNVLTQPNLLAAFDMLEQVRTFISTTDGVEYQLDDICVKIPQQVPPFGEECLVLSPFKAWNNNRALLAADSSVATSLNNTYTEKELSSFIGDLKYDNSGLPTSGKAVRISMFLVNNATDPDPNDGTSEERDLVAEQWEEDLVTLTVDLSSELDTSAWDNAISVYPQSGFSFSSEVGGAISGDVPISTASYFIIIAYIVFALGNKCDRTASSVAIAFLGVATIGISIVSAFGLCQYFGIKFGNTHSVLPFIVLGVGSDGIFILTNAFRRTGVEEYAGKTLAERSGLALSHAGVSLTVSSLTNVLAFAVGSLTVIPDLASFGRYASLSLFFLWVYLCTFFMACLVLNERRMDKNKLDCCCCVTDCRDPETVQSNRVTTFEPSFLSKLMRTKYAPLVNTGWFQALVIIATIGTVSFLGYMISKLKVESTGANFLPEGSYLKTNFDLQAELYGGSNTAVQVVIKEFNYDDKAELYGLANKYRAVAEEAYLDPTFTYFLEKFADDLDAYPGSNLTSFDVDLGEIPADAAVGGKRFPSSSVLLSKYLKLWLADPFGGIRFGEDIVFDGDVIVRARVQMEHLPIGSEDEDGIFKEDAAEVVKAVDKMYEVSDSFSFTVYPYAFKYTDEWASFAIIGQELLQNTILALVCVLVVVTILIGHLATSFWVFLMVVFTIVELLGMNAVLGLAIDTVVTVLVVLSIGLGVDYSAHIAHSFMLQRGSRAERIGLVLEDIAVPVLNGCISTFLAIMLQSLSKSYVFVVVFYEFLFAIVFGALNGLVLLPVILSLVGPRPYAKSPDIH